MNQTPHQISRNSWHYRLVAGNYPGTIEGDVRHAAYYWLWKVPFSAAYGAVLWVIFAAGMTSLLSFFWAIVCPICWLAGFTSTYFHTLDPEWQAHADIKFFYPYKYAPHPARFRRLAPWQILAPALAVGLVALVIWGDHAAHRYLLAIAEVTGIGLGLVFAFFAGWAAWVWVPVACRAIARWWNNRRSTVVFVNDDLVSAGSDRS